MSLSTVTDVLVIGAGQAGLAVAHAISSAHLHCVVHERNARIGDSWRARFDSLTLFSSRRMSALPGLSHAGERWGWPTKDDMADYLERFAKHFTLPVVTADGIASLSRVQSAFVALTDSGKCVWAGAVVIATGTFQRPRVPDFAGRLSERVQQLDPLSYRNPSTVLGRNVVVVGDGATGRQIALELASHRSVTLATGSPRHHGPRRLFGMDFTWWAWKAGLLTADKASPVGRLVRIADSTPGLHLGSAPLRRAGVHMVPRCCGASADGLRFKDGTFCPCDTVIWTMGYEDDTSWLAIDGAATSTRFTHERGVSPIAGLYYVGREWQSSRASGLICGVHIDAGAIVKHVKSHLRQNRWNRFDDYRSRLASGHHGVPHLTKSFDTGGS